MSTAKTRSTSQVRMWLGPRSIYHENDLARHLGVHIITKLRGTRTGQYAVTASWSRCMCRGTNSTSVVERMALIGSEHEAGVPHQSVAGVPGGSTVSRVQLALCCKRFVCGYNARWTVDTGKVDTGYRWPMRSGSARSEGILQFGRPGRDHGPRDR